jgi:curved DNA-binding protein CbpA
MPKPHEVLSVSPDAPWNVVQESYRRLARQHHPDKGGDVEEFQKVHRAYAALRLKHESQGIFDDIFSEVAAKWRA